MTFSLITNFFQIHKTAMSQRFAHCYAKLYLGKIEREALTKYFLQPTLYLRYMDDIWPYSNPQFSEFIIILNSHHYSNHIHKTLQTQFKLTDTHALLHKPSYHPKHTFKRIIKSQLLHFNVFAPEREGNMRQSARYFITSSSRDISYASNTLLKITLLCLSPSTPSPRHTHPAPHNHPYSKF